jgi:uncharacterized glyoxalase superfamily protein PhnB
LGSRLEHSGDRGGHREGGGGAVRVALLEVVSGAAMVSVTRCGKGRLADPSDIRQTLLVPLPEGRAAVGMNKTIPALPVNDVGAAVAHYSDYFGFEARYATDDFAILVRDDAVLHLWGATDELWRVREDLTARPICSGAESFLAGTASCRIEVADVDALFRELQPRGVLHDDSQGEAETTVYGTREFATDDLDGNLLIFFRRSAEPT